LNDGEARLTREVGRVSMAVRILYNTYMYENYLVSYECLSARCITRRCNRDLSAALRATRVSNEILSASWVVRAFVAN